MTTAYFDKHRERLDAAVAACASREYYSAFDESPSPRVYGEPAAAEGKAAVQAGGAHALDRALEAVAYAWVEMTRTPRTAIWEKPGKVPVTMEKTFTVVPRGVALVIGCNTFPTWNSWPGLFASLVTGNSVVVKPHPSAVLPLAITVQVCQEVLSEAGLDPHLVTLAAEEPADKLASSLALRPEVR